MKIRKTHFVIKLGALGDFVQATTAFQALRSKHSEDRLVLLTTLPYLAFAKRLNIFDDIWVDPRAPLWNFKKNIKLYLKLRKQPVDRVYDLQGVDRTQIYKFILKGTYRKWIGYYQKHSNIHPQIKFEKLLKSCGLETFNNALNLQHVAHYDLLEQLNKPYVLFVPGSSSAHNNAKKWPQENFINLAKYFIDHKINVVLIGGKDQDFSEIENSHPTIKNLCGETSFFDIIGLGAKALLTVGNDTGPTLLAASGGSPTITLFSEHNPPNKGGAKGEKHHQIYKSNIANITVEKVWEIAIKHIN